MTDSTRPRPIIHRKLGGFLEVAPGDWMRWRDIARVKDLGVVFPDDRPPHYAVKVWQYGGGHATRAFTTREDAMDWTDALFAVIQSERETSGRR